MGKVSPANINFIQILTILHTITNFSGDSFKYRKYYTPRAILVYCACLGQFHIGNLYKTVPWTVFYSDSFTYYTGSIGRSRGACQAHAPYRTQFFHFRIHFCQKVPTSEVQGPPPTGNPGSATGFNVLW